MSFDEWWNDQDCGAPSLVFNTEEDMARAAWDAASRIEREECAKIAETTEAEYIAEEIRSKA